MQATWSRWTAWRGVANIRDFKLRIIVSTDLIARGVDLGQLPADYFCDQLSSGAVCSMR